nr:hypothetical protein Iba_chr15bCG4380 [Ipomoea batatas]GMD96410.1 hypothetical protein Iba_chr15bCG4470 [Ipomoea batatas]
MDSGGMAQWWTGRRWRPRKHKRKGKLERRKLRQRLGCVAGDGGGGAVVVKPDGQWRDGAVVDRKTVEAAGEKAVTRWGGERSLAVEVEEFLMEWVVRSMARKLQRATWDDDIENDMQCCFCHMAAKWRSNPA